LDLLKLLLHSACSGSSGQTTSQVCIGEYVKSERRD